MRQLTGFLVLERIPESTGYRASVTPTLASARFLVDGAIEAEGPFLLPAWLCEAIARGEGAFKRLTEFKTLITDIAETADLAGHARDR